jgi:hypothetical protein
MVRACGSYHGKFPLVPHDIAFDSLQELIAIHRFPLRGAQDIPRFATLSRISEGFPAFGEYEESQPGQRRFKEELWSPRLVWSAVRLFWQLLPPGSDISLCMGLVPSWALERITGPLMILEALLGTLVATYGSI